MVARKQIPNLITDETVAPILAHYHSVPLYCEASANLQELKRTGASYGEMRNYLTSSQFEDLAERHEMILHWIVDQWEAFFLETGKRYSA